MFEIGILFCWIVCCSFSFKLIIFAINFMVKYNSKAFSNSLFNFYKLDFNVSYVIFIISFPFYFTKIMKYGIIVYSGKYRILYSYLLHTKQEYVLFCICIWYNAIISIPRLIRPHQPTRADKC